MTNTTSVDSSLVVAAPVFMSAAEFQQLNHDLTINYKGSAVAEVLRMLLKSKDYAQFEARVLKGFTPISSRVKLANGARAFQCRDQLLESIKRSLAVAVSRKESPEFYLGDTLRYKKPFILPNQALLPTEFFSQKLLFVDKFINSSA